MPLHNPTRAALAAGALFTDEAGRVLLVEPTYKAYRDIPGGYVEPGESPAAACAREVHEELGIRADIGPLLVVDWARTVKDGDKLLFVFDGGHLSPEQHDAIHFPDGELAGWEYVAPEDLGDHTIERLVLRIQAALAAKRDGGAAYLEYGRPVPAAAADRSFSRP
ncbi:NUDIX domain-containing protein [Phytomonospora endophytica]|uniref:8-oxo-dGTP pyrophosphatase MutT (NUDIX family) n=1 Tax=Phytomonospora endophytica TaxID=714109 RepID=A0A841FR00_9ACTN|nr:NUDIX hydrolase [Phytomonospora endophytica]MBB6039721.1 8-oxo-dGTP pyrophosphatase MutT (NUDIX family) [Phytomonospora endophytica]GIG70943.1 hypothetical protein Pen01_72380 [Phytomonospora endophytica]